MNNDKVEGLLAEIVQKTGFVNIDQKDIDAFRRSVNDIDAVKVHGKDAELCNLLEGAITSLVEKNGSKELKRLLFSIRFPEECPVLLDHMNGVHHIVEKLDENVDCLWGISTVEGLQEDQIELIVVIGF